MNISSNSIIYINDSSTIVENNTNLNHEKEKEKADKKSK